MLPPRWRLYRCSNEVFIFMFTCAPGVFGCQSRLFWCVCPSQGLVVVWELHLERRGRPERVSVSWEHRGQTVTSLCWDTAALRVFAGDVGGKVSCVRAGSSKLGKVQEHWSVLTLEVLCMSVWPYMTVQSLGSVGLFNVFERSLWCSLSLHLFDQKYSTNSTIVKLYYNSCFVFEYILRCNLFLWWKL